MSQNLQPGAIGWVDLTVANAEEVRDFYAAVAGWRPEPVPMSDSDSEYADFSMMNPATGTPAAGVCHARGENAALPPVWMIYIVVADLDAALAEAAKRGGEIISPMRHAGEARYAVIRDPAGASCALFQPAP